MPVHVRMSANTGVARIATGSSQLCLFGGILVIRSVYQKIRVHIRMRKQPANHTRIVVAVVSHLLHGPFTQIVVTRQASVARLVKGSHPERMIPRRKTVRAPQPSLSLILASCGGFCVINSADHRRKK